MNSMWESDQITIFVGKMAFSLKSISILSLMQHFDTKSPIFSPKIFFKIFFKLKNQSQFYHRCSILIRNRQFFSP
jgi:hypothetical protein